MPDYTAPQLRARLESWGYDVETEESRLRGNDRWCAVASRHGGMFSALGFTEANALAELVQRLVPFDVIMGGLGNDTTTAPTITYSPRAAGLIAAIVELDRREVCESMAVDNLSPELARLCDALADIRAALKRAGIR